MAVHYLILMTAKHEQQFALPTGQVLTVEGLMNSIERMSIEVEDTLFALFVTSYAPHDSFDAADEDIHREGLGLVVVAAELEGPHLVFAVGTCGEDDDGQGGLAMAYLA